jgi:hypothetical protein
MSKDLREAIRAELLALDELGESQAPSARKVLSRLWAQAAAERFEIGDQARVIAEAVARSQQASLAASSAGGGIGRCAPDAGVHTRRHQERRDSLTKTSTRNWRCL